MKKIVLYAVCAVTLFSGCSNAGNGAYTGASLGAILGSAIGGISGGPRGSDIGTLMGMAGGAVAGAAIGSANEKAQQDKYRQWREQREASYGRGTRSESVNNYNYGQDNADNGFDPTNSGDDRIEMEPSTGKGTYPEDVQNTNRPSAKHDTYTTVQPRTISVDQLERAVPGYSVEYNSLIEVRNATLVDGNGDGMLSAGETCKVTFEIMNRSSVTLYDVQPTVIETTGNKHVHVSPNLRVESISPYKGVRYTATVFADNRIKDGEIVLKVAVVQGNNEITSQMKEFTVKTSRR